jgi:UDP-GlcNAc:undecaprenyl-phosphate GlcNAc-1-phosphate transferase
MFADLLHPFIVTILAFFLSLVLTYLVRALARKIGFVAKPKKDRWHKKPTAMMGGTSIFLTTIIIFVLFVPFTTQSLVVIGASSFLFLVGLIDDILHIKPYQKLFGQLIGTAVVITAGLVLPWTDYAIVNIFVTAFWLIGITNALNLLDNMDGLAAGIATIAAFSLALVLGTNGQPDDVRLISVFIAALLGFLTFNFNPASIFMGDCGSMFVGFFLASSVLLNQTGGQSRSIVSVLAVPVLTLFVPIFDTTFVTILRKLRGLPASQGGRDHTSHRLVALGLTERKAVLLLYGLAVLAGILAFFVIHVRAEYSIASIALFIALLTIIGVYLSQVKVYEEQDEEKALKNKAVFGFLITLSYKRRIFEIVLDILLISVSYYWGFVLLFGSISNTANLDLYLKSLPLLVVLTLGSFLFAGVYRGLWRYTSINDFVTFTKGVVLGSFFTIIGLVLIYRFEGYSRTVFILHSIILLFLVSASRMAFRLFRQLLPTPVSKDGRRVLIYGAGDGGELMLRELFNNPDLNYNPVGFLDDDPMMKGKVIHGLQVLGGNGSLSVICEQNNVQEILVSIRNIKPERLKELRLECEDAAVEIKRASFKIEPLDEIFE